MNLRHLTVFILSYVLLLVMVFCAKIHLKKQKRDFCPLLELLSEISIAESIFSVKIPRILSYCLHRSLLGLMPCPILLKNKRVIRVIK